MPTYEYRCAACDHLWEDIRPMSAILPAGKCPACASVKTARVYETAPRVSFPDHHSWHSKGNGRGQWIAGLGKKSDPKAYATSLSDGIEKAKRRNLTFDVA